MDITRYIGLYLLKHHFCYVHGLGNLEVVKRPAIHDGKALQAPSYEVIVTPGGSIDDNVANFIATNEQISISKAANALRDFSTESRKVMSAGGAVPIPGIGSLIEENGKVKFVTDANFSFTPAGLPTIKNSKQLEEQNARHAHKPAYPAPQKADSVNWSMVILLIVLLLIIGGGIFGIYYYSNLNKAETAAAPAPVAKDTVKQAPPPVAVVDTAIKPKDSSAVVAPVRSDSVQVNTYRMVIGNYRTRARVEQRIFNLTKGGNHVEMVPKDSTSFLVITAINCKATDTTHVIDSLRRMFGYKGVTIYK
jgi:hypothetical protein